MKLISVSQEKIDSKIAVSTSTSYLTVKLTTFYPGFVFFILCPIHTYFRRPGSHNLCNVGTNNVYHQHIFDLSTLSQTDEESQRFRRNPSRLWLRAGDVDGFDFLTEGATLPTSVSEQSQK